MVNGRRRRCAILSLRVVGSDIIADEVTLSQHIYGFYRELLGSSEAGTTHIMTSAWESAGRVSEADNLALVLPFSLDEITRNLNEMRPNTVPGPDGFPVIFYKKFWHMIGPQFARLVNDFMRGHIDIKRLNYGVLALIPKVDGADTIRQYRPITLINVSFRLFAKGFATRLAPVAHKVIDPNQTTFIKGRRILDGIVILHEVRHDIRCSEEEVFILKIDFEKAYNRV